MKFKIIPNQHTPKVQLIDSPERFIKENTKLLEKFISFARRQHNCVGLAANQVSLDGERIMKDFFVIKTEHTWDIIIQPKTLAYQGRSLRKIETCLSWPGRKLAANRYPCIKVKYYNLKGELRGKSVVNHEAQIWQHECDHLLGIRKEFI